MVKTDFMEFWPSFQKIIQLQETYSIDPNITQERAYSLWCQIPQETYCVKKENEIVGTYYIKKNAEGPGSHICNCGYMVEPNKQGAGIGKSMLNHSIERATLLGYLGMQFNSVVSTNKKAIDLWLNAGFKIIGTIPGGYLHNKKGYVDCLIMFKSLNQS